MREFFHGWRRKAGCVALGLVCVIASLWVRSNRLADEICILTKDREHEIGSMFGLFVWRATDKHTNVSRNFWITMKTEDMDLTVVSVVPQLEQQILELQEFHPRQWIVHYWSVTIPPTLLSAYLLLWKPRKRASPN